MGKSDPVTVGSNDICHIIFHIRTQRSGTQTQTVIFIIYHMKKPSYRFFITKQSRNPENIPWGIILMDRHLDPGLMAGRHNGFQKILQVFPEFFLRHRAVRLKKFIQLRHPLRLPARKCFPVQIFQDILRHLLIIILYLAFFII